MKSNRWKGRSRIEISFLLILCILLLNYPVNSCLGRHQHDKKRSISLVLLNRVWHTERRILPHFHSSPLSRGKCNFGISSGQKLWHPAEESAREEMSCVDTQQGWLTYECLVSPVTSSKRGIKYKKRKKILACWTFVSKKGVPPKWHRYNWLEVWGSLFSSTLANECRNQHKEG